MGGGANGIFVLDVTSPTTFGASNVMFEFTDQDDVDMGSVLSQPKIVKMRMADTDPPSTPVYKWFVAVSSGYNNYKNDGRFSLTGRQALFLLSLDKTGPWVEGSNYFKVMLSDPPTITAAGLANPGYATGSQGEATLFYAGDLSGNMWRFDFSKGLSSSTAAGAAKTDGGTGSLLPMMIAKDSTGVRQPITIAPTVSAGLSKGNMIVFGTGKFLEPSDSDSVSPQTMYGVWDSLTTAAANFEIGRSKLFQRTMVIGTTTTTLSGTTTFAFGEGSGSTYRGWYVDLPTTRERVAVEGVVGPGFTAINSVIPDGTCSGDGSGVAMCFNNLFGAQVCDFSRSTAGLLGRPNIISMDNAFEAYGLQSATGRRVLTLKLGTISTGTKITDAGNVQAQSSSREISIRFPTTDRTGWREIRNFKDN